LESRKALILLGHGSRAPGAFEEMLDLARRLQSQNPGILIVSAYLSLSQPDLPEAVAQAVAQGAAEIRILPLFFFSGKHVQEDIPRLAAQTQAAHPDTRIVLLEAAGRHADFTGFVGRAAGLAPEG
jgi:sirohydrochlorin cobaltochelatase